MYRYIKTIISIEKRDNESDEKTEQRLRELLVDSGFVICYIPEFKENYNF